MSREFTRDMHSLALLLRKGPRTSAFVSLYRFGENQGPNMIFLRAPQN
jgi:hypothetical protein